MTRPDPGWPVFGPAWISVVEMVAIFGGIAAAIYPSRPHGFTAGLPIVGMLAMAVIGLRVLDVPRRTPDCRSDAALAEWFRRRFFFRWIRTTRLLDASALSILKCDPRDRQAF